MKYQVIKVQKGDTADSISRKYNTTVRSIYEHNKPLFFEGERLVICNEEGIRYTVMPFDTIDSIAKKFDVSAEDLADYNQIKAVFLGQTIIIPNEVDY